MGVRHVTPRAPVDGGERAVGQPSETQLQGVVGGLRLTEHQAHRWRRRRARGTFRHRHAGGQAGHGGMRQLEVLLRGGVSLEPPSQRAAQCLGQAPLRVKARAGDSRHIRKKRGHALRPRDRAVAQQVDASGVDVGHDRNLNRARMAQGRGIHHIAGAVRHRRPDHAVGAVGREGRRRDEGGIIDRGGFRLLAQQVALRQLPHEGKEDTAVDAQEERAAVAEQVGGQADGEERAEQDQRHARAPDAQKVAQPFLRERRETKCSAQIHDVPKWIRGSINR
ncbi:MAG: hypothetical protein BWX70_03015 [Verrucomicrobia bacterium ADurb.Bin070]|nr:MAG: hypothetical protein BWX70_03015 [Verrucomicrobia bacterium ADurb.Bin070]